ncbi:hypothetical protein PI172_2461 [Prevotella intermedia]|uniref:Uncharacterized protein n=1 Tax=Prevotella intermedia TaxID=28131 RepID=A0AAD1F8E4_PREIN|nr:hypothetical protein PI172_2461 [Prevotella intermedia]
MKKKIVVEKPFISYQQEMLKYQCLGIFVFFPLPIAEA